jgi:hypothetical protein
VPETAVCGYPDPVVITWPEGKPDRLRMPGWAVCITSALTGEQITTVSGMDVVIHADAQTAVTADLAMFADEDGNPVPDGKPVLRDGEVLTGTFRATVAEMRVRAEAG